ncbi:MAG TPA: sigma factor, partial [Gammaproteobacteria bacterium]|nr:sigma factor [Gammaproteobacteria bacterium]
MHNLEQTIRECQQGNALAWEALIKRYQGKVYGMAYYFLRDKGEAEDASQETFIKVYRKIETFRSDQDSFVPWLLT